MPPVLAPAHPRYWRLTQHALERMAERGVSREEVIEALTDPEITHDSGTDPEVRVASRGRLRVPYNTRTGDVLTVARREDQELEQPMSGWINLDARQAEKLLLDWGFEIHSQKDKSNLWRHPDDPDNRLVPFSIPSRGARANGKGSFRTAAQIVGVSVNEFQQGPTEGWQERARLLREVEKIDEVHTGPDPLGIREEVVAQRAAQLAEEVATYRKKVEQEPRVRTVGAEKVEAALHAITGDALTSTEVSHLLEVSPTTAKQALNELVTAGKAVRRMAQTWELTTPGRPGFLYLAGPVGTEIPPRYQKEPPPPAAPLDPYPVPTTPQPEEIAPVSVVAVPAPATASPVTDPDAPRERLFTATGTTWPTGGLLIQDEDGVFYVARKLVEEGR